MATLVASEDVSSFLRKIGDEMVLIFVGPKRKKYAVHKTLLCSVPRVFDKGFNGGFAEARSKEIYLPDDRTEIFDIFVAWLYGNSLDPCDKWDTKTYINLYIFADAKQCNSLKNVTMDLLQDVLDTGKCILEIEDIERIFDNTMNAANAPIRKFCTAWCMFLMVEMREWSPKILADLFKAQPEIIAEYITIQFELGGTNGCDPTVRGKSGPYHACYFHIHEKGEILCLTKK